MPSGNTGHVMSAEWRWVILIASILVLIAFMPFLWVLLIGIAGSKWQFMGALHDYSGAALELSHVFQGSQGYWQTLFLYTPEVHNSTFIDPLYALLGQVSRVTSLSTIAIFHAARVGAAMFMYLALYQLGAAIWMRIRARRIFFILAAVGSGFGWLLSPLTENATYLDIITPQSFPFYSTLVNVHYPLTIAAFCLLAALIIDIFRPGQVEGPTFENGGLNILLLGLLVAFIYPLVLAPLATAFVLNFLVHWYRHRQSSQAQLRWLIWFLAPIIPVIVYYAALISYNSVIQEIWNQQNSLTAPSPLVLSLSLGIVLFIGAPGIYRAVRRFEPDGDQFMLLWLVAMIVYIYIPVGIHERFAAGLMLPLAYFATRSIEDFWFSLIHGRWRLRLFVALIPVIAATNVFALLLPLRPISVGDFEEASGMLLERDYLKAFEWLKRNGNSDDVVLASPNVSAWLPAWSGNRVVYGHPNATVSGLEKKRAVEGWFRLQSLEGCEMLLNGNVRFDSSRPYEVHYVLIGPQELALGNARCVADLERVGVFDTVRLYAYSSKSQD